MVVYPADDYRLIGEFLIESAAEIYFRIFKLYYVTSETHTSMSPGNDLL